MENGIDALGLIASVGLLAVAAGMFLGRLENILESSRARQPARLRPSGGGPRETVANRRLDKSSIPGLRQER